MFDLACVLYSLQKEFVGSLSLAVVNVSLYWLCDNIADGK